MGETYYEWFKTYSKPGEVTIKTEIKQIEIAVHWVTFFHNEKDLDLSMFQVLRYDQINTNPLTSMLGIEYEL